MIINGELGTGVAGGVCRVSTTVFNAAFEAGLNITERTNHALYISHYPLGRDATVNYPDLDLKFVNDTEHWLLLRTFVGSDSLVVGLYGTPVHRRVFSETTPLKATGPVPVQQVDDPAMLQGHSYVEESGVPPQETSVHRMVAASGTLLHDDTWTSYYEGEKRVIGGLDEGASAAPQPTTTTETRPRRRRPRRRPPKRRRLPHVDSAAEDAARSARSTQPEPLGHAGRPQRPGVHQACDVAVGDRFAGPLDRVVEAEGAPRLTRHSACGSQHVVEAGWSAVPDMRLQRRGLDPLVAGLVAAREAREVLDARDLEPVEVGGVVGDALRIGLEADLQLGGETELTTGVHEPADRHSGSSRSAQRKLAVDRVVVARLDGDPCRSGLFRSSGAWPP